MKFKRVTLIVGSYVCPETPAAIERVKDALADDFLIHSRSSELWEVESMLSVEDVEEKDAKAAVPNWLWEDLAELEEE